LLRNNRILSLLSTNIKVSRRRAGLTQQELAEMAEVGRGTITAYEKGRAVPPLSVMVKLSDALNVSIDTIVKKDLQNDKVDSTKLSSDTGVITIDINGLENVELVDHKAAAGYVKGYRDVDYIAALERISLPNLSRNRTYRAFEIEGDSMFPIPSKSIIVAERVMDFKEIKNGELCIVVTRDGIVFKRVFSLSLEKGWLLLISDNTQYQPQSISMKTVLEVWKKKTIISEEIYEERDLIGSQVASIFIGVQNQVSKLKKKSKGL
jgi:DNA-binding XRE family transcriptional regulator